MLHFPILDVVSKSAEASGSLSSMSLVGWKSDTDGKSNNL